MRRSLSVSALTIVLVLAIGGTAFAHECFNASRSDKGNAGAAGSNGWFTLSLEELYGFVVASHDDPEFNLPSADPALIPDMVDAAIALGVPDGFLLNAHTTAAGGLEGHDRNGVLADGKGIDHFPEVYVVQLITAYCMVADGDPAGTTCEQI